MYDVRISDQLYEQASQAAQGHRVSVDQFIAEAVQLRLREDAEDYDHIFTPEVIAELDAAAAEVRAGKSLSGMQVDQDLAANKAQWLANHPN